MRESLTVWVQPHSQSFHTPQFIFSIHGITSSKIVPLTFLILGCKYVTGNFLYFMFAPPIGNLIWAVMGFCNVFENWASKKKSGHTGNWKWFFYWTKKDIWKHPRSYLIYCPTTIICNLVLDLKHLDDYNVVYGWYWIRFSSWSRVAVLIGSHEFNF